MKRATRIEKNEKSEAVLSGTGSRANVRSLLSHVGLTLGNVGPALPLLNATWGAPSKQIGHVLLQMFQFNVSCY